MTAEHVSYTAAFVYGLLSFFSPCILPLIPAYFTFITGYSLEELTDDNTAIRKKVIGSTITYVLGFSTVFIFLGASASFLGTILQTHQGWLRVVGGVLIIALGIHLTGVLRIPGLDVEKRLHVKKKPLHLIGTFIVGMAFAAGWSPCIGPLLGSILIIAGSQESVQQGIALLALYSAGLAIPFLLISVFINYLLVFLTKAVRLVRIVNIAAGILLILTGVALITNRFDAFMRFLPA
jgi:cytochrome c-type biogenesis protein